MDQTQPGDVEDLATLARLDEKVLMNELKVRYSKDRIYTYVGDILVALNPFKDTGIYGQDVSSKYKRAKRGSQPPHIFAVADSVYQNMLGLRGTQPKNQCILISGESGAGKTESTKFIIRQLMELCQGNTQLEQQILQVNPLLEAFGNAQTLMNDNSSRFGKYIDLKFQNGRVTGSKISEYLLEKSRFISQSRGEQNFHIFYYMFAGLTPEQQNKYKLNKPDSYKYFTDGASCLKKVSNKLKTQYEELINAMDMVGFTDEEQDDMFAVLSGALTTGNIDIDANDDEESVINKVDALATVCKLWGLDSNEMMSVMTCSRTFTKGDEIRRNYNKSQAIDSRDAIAKTVYGRLFSWIVNKINQLLAPPLIEGDASESKEIAIGLLDIFGFEHFDKNSFEQASINLANEQLQFFFNKHIFMLEQEEYRKEGVDWTEIKFVDNQPLLDLFLGKPIGLLTLLDEETHFPKGSDQSFVDKLNMKFDHDPHYTKSAHANSGTFTINHYAGKVIYSSDGWLEKNRDTLPPGVMEMLQQSKNPLLSLIFKGKISRTGTLALRSVSRMSRQSTARQIKAAAQATKERKLTVGAQFRNSLGVLMEKMSSSQPVFIRCIKPNGKKAPKLFEDSYVEAQLLYTGMLETTQIRRKGFAIRPTFAEFVEKYRLLAKSKHCPPTAESSHNILTAAKITGWQIGKTKVFLKYYHIDKMVELMEEMAKQAVHLQRVARGFIARRKVGRMRAEAEKQARQVQLLLEEINNLNITFHESQMRKKTEDSNIPKDYFEKAKQEALPTPLGIIGANTVSMATQSNTIEEEDEDDDDLSEDTFKPVKSKDLLKFGKPGTKDATVQWFKQTQSVKLKSPEGKFFDWFHGIITRREAERLLQDKVKGCFLIRVSESRFGYSLSYKAEERCRHYMVDQTVAGKYIIIGEPKVHRTLNDLIEYHKQHMLSNWNGTLSVACGQEDGECNYSDLMELNNLIGLTSNRSTYSSTSQVPPELPKRNYTRNNDNENMGKPLPKPHGAPQAYQSLLSAQQSQNEVDGIKRRISKPVRTINKKT